MRRRKLNRRKSKKMFSKGASRVNKRNMARPMRGGYRL